MSRSAGAPGSLDWGVGRYETTAEQLAPAARVVVERAAVQPGERILDLGCGTGNAALLAARPGVEVTGVDLAPRLLEVARARAEAAGARVSFQPGEATAIPLADASVDVIVSVFAVIFALDPGAAAAEASRVLTPGGRIVLSAWVPTGVIHEMNSVAAEAVMQARGAPAQPERFPWHDPCALRTLFGPHGFRIETEEHSLEFQAASVDDYLDSETRNHPMAVTGMAILDRLGQADALRERLYGILSEGNEDSPAFRATSRYVVARLTHDVSAGQSTPGHSRRYPARLVALHSTASGMGPRASGWVGAQDRCCGRYRPIRHRRDHSGNISHNSPTMDREPITGYAKSGDLSIAYQVVGDGPRDLVFVPGFVSHIDLSWEIQPFAQAAHRFKSFSRLIVFDKRGTGLSDRTAGLSTLAELMDDIRAVMDAAGSERAVIVGLSQGGPAATLFAATFPERTISLVLWLAAAPLPLDQRDDATRVVFNLIHDYIGSHWGDGTTTRLLLHGAPGDEATDRLIARFERNSATPAVAQGIYSRAATFDARAVLAAVGVPTLVVGHVGDPVIPIDEVRTVAGQIAGSRLVELSVAGHVCWDWDRSRAISI